MLHRLLALFLLVSLGTVPGLAHDGHDHGAPLPPVSNTISPRIDASSDVFELVGVLRAGKLTVFVDRFITNEPILEAEVEIETPKGAVKASRNPDGTFVLDAAWAKPGDAYDLIFTVTAGADIDVLTGQLKVPADGAGAGVAPPLSSFASVVIKGLRERAIRWDPTLAVVAIGAFAAGLLVARRRKGAGAAAVAILSAGLAIALSPTPVRADTVPEKTAAQSSVDLSQRFPEGAVFVPKATQRILGVRTIMVKPEEHRRAMALPGRVIADPSASGAVQTSLTGRLSPPAGGFPRLGQRVSAGDVLALVQPAISSADITTQQQQARELEQQIALVKRRLERLRPIANVIARSQIEDAELEFAGLEKRKANLERAQKREPELLTAPVNGVIASAAATPGQVVEVNTVLFQVVDPDRLWIEALTFDALAGAKAGTARLNDGRSLKLEYQGTGLADRNQAIPIQFAVNENSRGLRMGQLLTVLVETEESKTGMAVPRTAVVRAENGQMIVYEHANAERFVPREVRVEPLDGDRMLVLSGLEANKRIVTQGVELLNQIR